MANFNYVETAKQYLDALQKMVDRLDASSRSLNSLLDDAKKAEAEKLNQEAEERKARIEQNRQERLRQMFDSESSSAVHVGGEEEPVPAETPAGKEPEPAPAVEQPEKKEEVHIEEAQAKEPEPVPDAPKKAEPSEPVPVPPKKKASGYEARPIAQDTSRRQPAPASYRPNPAGQSGGYQQRQTAPGRNAG